MHKLFESYKFANLFGKNPFLMSNFVERERERVRAKYRVPIGYSREDLLGEPVYLDLKEPCGMSIVAIRGGGKTTLISNIIANAWLNGFKIVIAFDYRDEYKEKFFGVLRRIASFNVCEEAKMLYRRLSPAFLDNRAEKFLFDMDELGMGDIFTAFGIEEGSYSPQETALRIIFDRLKRKGFQPTLRVLKKVFMNEKIFNEITQGLVAKQTRNAFVARILDMSSYKVFGKMEFDFRSALFDPSILNFVYKGFDKSSLRNFLYVYLAIIERKIRTLLGERRQDTIVVYDEASIPCPKRAHLPCKDEIKESLQRGREWGESMIFGIQEISQVDDVVLGQSRYVFINPMTRRTYVNKIINDMNLRDTVGLRIFDALSMINYWREKGMIKNWPWIMIDRFADKPKVVFPMVIV